MRIAFVKVKSLGLLAIAQAALLAPVLAADAPPISFRNQVQPILARYGCSSGACHGSAAGQGGFRLSLLGYDDVGDHINITRSALGRRVSLDDPARSLFLLKATKTIAHKGGEKFKVDSPEYQILAQWIAEGAAGPKADDARIERIVISPGHATLKLGQSQPLKVTAFFNNGRQEDVTRWTKYTSGNQSVATADSDGLVKITGRGEGTITAWYLSKLSIATVTVPYDQPVIAEAFKAFQPRNFIDERVKEKLVELNIPPSSRSRDEDFIRRAYLDTIGVLPSLEETRAFLASKDVNKREAVINSLLTRPEFVDYWTYKWSDLLLVNSDKLPVQPMWAYYQWIRQNVASNTPWDVMVRTLLTSTGSTLENGAGNFFVLHDEPTRLAETVSTAFLGMSIACAKCHNHPMEKWTNDQYFAFANLVSRVRVKNGTVKDERVIFHSPEGDLVQPLTNTAKQPTPLDGKPISLTSPEDRRVALADWLVSPENPYFSRAITNRVWKNFFGVALVESVDDLRMTNPASNERLLNEAAQFLGKNRFDLRALMRVILQSETYQRSSEALAGNKDDTRFYARYYPKRLMAEVMLDAVSQVTAVPTSFNRDERNANKGVGAAYPMGYRAMQLPDSNTISYFLTSFGRPDREQTCDCERTNEPSMAQALHIANGNTLNEKLAQPNNRVQTLLASGKDDAAIVEDAYLTALSRRPTDKEKSSILAMLAGSTDAAVRRATLEDVLWGLMSSQEFIFNH